MITESTIYWILKLDDLRGICLLMSILSGVLAVVSSIAWWCSSDLGDNPKVPRSICLKMVAVFMVCVIVGSLLPSTKQMAMIKVIPAITNSEFAADMSKDAKELYKMGIEAIKEQLTNKKNNGETSK